MSIQDKPTKYRYHYLARIVIEAVTPLVVGSGEKNILTDSVILKGVNGLPYIPGTSLTGCLRHTLTNNEDKQLFGSNEKNGKGSLIIFSEAVLIGKEGKVLDGIQAIDWKDPFYELFKFLPIRQHVRIDEKGTAQEGGKFDEQIINKGTRFCFEVEMLSESESDQFKRILDHLALDTFRIGAGSRKGFGNVRIIKEQSKWQCLDLQNRDHLLGYLQKDSSLSNTNFWENPKMELLETNPKDTGHTLKYEISLVPDDFFLCGSGFGDDDVDITPVMESIIIWDNSDLPKPDVQNKNILIPASSIKGALSHRTAFYWNKFAGKFVGKEGVFTPLTGNENPAVYSLFGTSGTTAKKLRGNVLCSDILQQSKHNQEKVFNHVAIDRFTGGAMDGALFSEKVLYEKGTVFQITLVVDEAGIAKNLSSMDTTLEAVKIEKEKAQVITAFESALKDLLNGMLPLGGGVNRGHGVFLGECKKNGEVMFNNVK